MKTIAKQLIAALAIAFCPITLTAQDTILWQFNPPDNYLAPEWPDSAIYNQCSTVARTDFSVYDRGGVINYTDTALTVYGIAASLVTELDIAGPAQIAQDSLQIQNPAREDLNNEHLILWEMEGLRDSNIYQVGEDLLVKFSSEQPDYYWYFQLPVTISGNYLRPFPMYERYFTEPIVVQDSFIVGILRCNGFAYDKPDHLFNLKTWPVYISAFIFMNPYSDDPFFEVPPHHIWGDPHHYTDIDGYTVDTFYWHRAWLGHDGYIFIFPILTPNPDTTTTDTTGIGSDTTGVGIRRVEDRLVGVMPNPATNEVKVVSSFGLRHIDAYDAAGRRILSRDAQGLQTHIDVGDWPRGAYTLHILTPAGTTVKKLLVE